MSNFISYAGEFTKPEKRTQSLKNFMLYLYVSGFDYMRVSKIKPPQPQSPYPQTMEFPFLALFPPGTMLDFSANGRRENWAAVFDMDDIELKEESFACTFHDVVLHTFVKLSMKRLLPLRNEFAGLTASLAAGHLAGAEKAKLLLGAILSELIADLPEKLMVRPEAAAMKAAIDSDEHFALTISELNARLGLCSLPYMRKLFFEEYGVLPGEYRNRQRMNRILELFSQTGDSLKMIADEVGMKHLPHLYAFLKERQELSPKELLNQFRGQKSK